MVAMGLPHLMSIMKRYDMVTEVQIMICCGIVMSVASALEDVSV